MSVYSYAWLPAHLYDCAYVVCINVGKHDLMQHGIHNTSGALSSLFFFFGTSYRAHPLIHDIYEAPMSLGACWPRRLRKLQQHDNKTPDTTRPSVSGTAAKHGGWSHAGERSEEKGSCLYRTSLMREWRSRQQEALKKRSCLVNANWSKKKGFSVQVNTAVFICTAALRALIPHLLVTRRREGRASC